MVTLVAFIWFQGATYVSERPYPSWSACYEAAFELQASLPPRTVRSWHCEPGAISRLDKRDGK